MDLKIIDNLLEPEEFRQVKHLFNSNYFPWYRSKILDDYELDCSTKDNLQFVHVFYQDHAPIGEYTNILPFFFEKMPVRSLVKVKSNLTLKTDKIIEHGFHTDFDNDDSYTAVYYVNTNNGYTLFEDGTKVESVENRLAIFNVNIPHTGTSCTDSECRIVINFNYF
jgi:hypothetical protein